ncbi:MAG: HD-GYP domain-containing protein [Lachnospiraceae bacterium]|nr:HD-GYP domain-containing protein [Lachnospiraceae bacterium]
MRYVPAAQLEPGMVIGQEIHDSMGVLLIHCGTVLTQDHVTRITYQGMAGVYIDDEMSRDIQIKEAVKPEVKAGAIKVVHDFFDRLGGGVDLSPEENLIQLMVENVVNDVMADEQVVYNLIDIRTYDDYTYAHSVHVGIISAIIGVKMNLPEDELNDLVTAGFLHDIGKVYIDPVIINAPRRLTPVEREEMMKHPDIGYMHLTKDFHFSDRVNQTVLQHHEWYNGHGYPNKVKGKDLLLTSRILRAADVYDAMTTKRPYHDPYLPSEVLEYIMGRNGMEFDPEIVEVMAAQFAIYPVGCEVVLSTKARGIVVENHPGFMMRPTVKLLETGEHLNLRDDRMAYNITITQLMM